MRDVDGQQGDLNRRRRFWWVAGAPAAVVGLLIGSGVAASRAEAGWGIAAGDTVGSRLRRRARRVSPGDLSFG